MYFWRVRIKIHVIQDISTSNTNNCAIYNQFRRSSIFRLDFCFVSNWFCLSFILKSHFQVEICDSIVCVCTVFCRTPVKQRRYRRVIARRDYSFGFRLFFRVNFGSVEVNNEFLSVRWPIFGYSSIRCQIWSWLTKWTIWIELIKHEHSGSAWKSISCKWKSFQSKFYLK